MKLTNRKIGDREDEESVKNLSSIAMKEEDKEYMTSQFYIKRKKNSRIPDEFKVKLVLDAKKNSLKIAEICKKYFLWDTTARSIIKEVTNWKQFPLNSEARMSKRRLEQDIIKKSIERWLCTS